MYTKSALEDVLPTDVILEGTQVSCIVSLCTNTHTYVNVPTDVGHMAILTMHACTCVYVCVRYNAKLPSVCVCIHMHECTCHTYA